CPAPSPRTTRRPATPAATSRPSARYASPVPDRSRDQSFDDHIRRLFRRDLRGVDVNLRGLRRFIRAVDAGEVLQLAGPGLLVQPLHVAPLGVFQLGVDEDLDELARL